MADDLISQFRRTYNSPIETDRQVATLALRDSISGGVRWEGMLVYVEETETTYQLGAGLLNGDWIELVGLPDAPVDGQKYIRKDGNWEVLPASSVPVSGTFVPTLIDSGGGATYSSTTAEGRYTRVGDLVTVSVRFIGINTTGGPTGVLKVGNLPYTTEANGISTGACYTSGGNANFYSIVAATFPTEKTLYFVTQTALDGNNALTLSAITFTAGALNVSITYFTND